MGLTKQHLRCFLHEQRRESTQTRGLRRLFLRGRGCTDCELFAVTCFEGAWQTNGASVDAWCRHGGLLQRLQRRKRWATEVLGPRRGRIVEDVVPSRGKMLLLEVSLKVVQWLGEPAQIQIRIG